MGKFEADIDSMSTSVAKLLRVVTFVALLLSFALTTVHAHGEDNHEQYCTVCSVAADKKWFDVPRTVALSVPSPVELPNVEGFCDCVILASRDLAPPARGPPLISQTA